jgi:hypothetical protein
LIGLLLMACIGPGLAVRAGLMNEFTMTLPPEGRHQLMIRIGNDAPPWDQRGGRPAAINMWAHDQQRERWHLINLIRIPLGGKPLPEDTSQPGWPPMGTP